MDKCGEENKDTNKADLCKHERFEPYLRKDCDPWLRFTVGHYDMITLTEGGNGIINKTAYAL